MSDLSTFIHGICFFTLFPALVLLMLLLDRVWPSNSDRQENVRQEDESTPHHARRSPQF